MPYAVNKDGSGWHAVDSKDDIDPEVEFYQEERPAMIVDDEEAQQ
jgi:hypothetical protein